MMLADDLAKEAATFAAGSRTRKLLHMAADAVRGASAPAAVREALEAAYDALGIVQLEGIAGLHCLEEVGKARDALDVVLAEIESATPQEASTAAGEAVSDSIPSFEIVKLQARAPDGGRWIDIFPSQLGPMTKNGFEVRAELRAAPPAAQTDGVSAAASPSPQDSIRERQ